MGLGQDDDGRLQPLGAVCRHDPHPAVGGVLIALHLDFCLAQPTQKAGQRRRIGALVGQGRPQEFTQCVRPLRPQPGGELLRSAEPVEQEAEEAVRGGCQLPAQGPDQPEHRLRLARSGIGGLDDGGLQRLARTPVVGPVEQPGLADPAKRAAQHGRQRQIVGGLEQVFGQHDQVANRDFLVQLEPVGPGHAHTPGLEPLGQGADERPGARPHQDHDVLGPHRALSPLQPARIARRGIAPGPARNAVGEDFGQLHFGAAFLVLVIVEQVDRRVLVLRRWFDLRPHLDQPASPRLAREVLGPAFAVEGQPAGVVAVAEQAVDGGQDRL